MERSPMPGERPVRKAYEGAECLYRDHLGRRVILDVEGSGRYTILVGETPVEIEVDGCASQAREGTFSESILVTARSEGRVEAFAEKDQPEGERRLIDTFSIQDLDALKQRDWKVQNISAVSLLDSCDEDGRRFQHPVASHLNKASWRCQIPVGTSGIVLSRLYDRFHGRQRARVLVDGAFVGWWYEAGQDRVCRWGVSEFFIPGKHLREEIEIAIDPPGGSPLFSVAKYNIFGLGPAKASASS